VAPDLSEADVWAIVATAQSRGDEPLRKGDRADLSGIDLRNANLRRANIEFVDLVDANCDDADLSKASLRRTDLSRAHLSRASLYEADFYQANLSGAILRDTNLVRARLVDTDLRGATLENCTVYGIAAWNLELEGATQQNLQVLDPADSGADRLTVGDLEMAQFIHLMLNNAKLRDVIDTITSKVVLILGSFTPERKRVLDALREALQTEGRDYVPVIFDFVKPSSRNLTETVTLLARMARFIIADLTDPKSLPQEATAIIPTLKVPFVPVIEGDREPYALFWDYIEDWWVLDIYHYLSADDLIESLDGLVGRAEAVAQEIAERRREIEERRLRQRPGPITGQADPAS
jgi:uncharacterized protein YjbI with pentapeptide repeats